MEVMSDHAANNQILLTADWILLSIENWHVLHMTLGKAFQDNPRGEKTEVLLKH